MLNSAAVLWFTGHQNVVAQSTAEAEYYTLGSAGQDITFLRELLSSINVPQTDPTLVYEDNQAAICIANNPLTSKKARHIMVKYHYIRQLIEEKSLTVECMPTDDMIADIFTKALDPVKHLKFTMKIMNIKN